MATHKKINDPTNNRRKVIMYGCVKMTPNGAVRVGRLHAKRSDAVAVVDRYQNIVARHGGTTACSVCKVEMLVPSEKNQWVITMSEYTHPDATNAASVRRITLDTVYRPVVWGTKKLSDEAMQAYIETYLADYDKEYVERVKEKNGTLIQFSNPRSPQIN